MPANIRMQTSSTGLAAISHLIAPQYSLICLQIKKKWYRAICCPFNAISRLKWHFTSNASLKHWLHPAIADDATLIVFPLQSSPRLSGELGQALSWQPAVRASSQHSFWSQTWNLYPGALQQGWGWQTTKEKRLLPGKWQEVNNPCTSGLHNFNLLLNILLNLIFHYIPSPGFASLKHSWGWASCWVSCHTADFCHTSPFYNLCETFYPSSSVSSPVLWEWSMQAVKSSKNAAWKQELISIFLLDYFFM